LNHPAPEQLRVNVVLPEIVIGTSSVPDVALDPLHWVEPDAVQDVALVVDQEKVDVLFNSTETGDAVKLIVGAGLGGGVLLPPPPPPPPPQAVISKVSKNKSLLFL
jgi:hypothetical protein